MCDVDGHVVKLFGACKSRQIRPSHHGPRDACTSAARVTVVIDPHGQVVGYEPEFNARTGPAELLGKLTTLHAGL